MKLPLTRTLSLLALTAVVVSAGLYTRAQPRHQELGYKDTPFLPGNKWHVHDSDRPQPKVIEPGTASTADTPGQPPSDATVLFDGKDLSRWHGNNGPAEWTVENGYVQVKPGSGYITTKEEFGDFQLHVEFSEPNPPHGDSQGRGNSGVFLHNRYEIQVLDGYHNPTYADGITASIYGQYPPLVNACRKPGEWQTYDILFFGPRFKDGKVETPAYVTVMHNGVCVHAHTALLGSTVHRALAQYEIYSGKGPIALQDHGDPVRYRNIWIREIKADDEN